MGKPIRVPNKPRGWIFGARWAQIPCEARACKVIIGAAPQEGYWCAALVGQERKAIEIKFDGRLIYLDNEDGRALNIMLSGMAPLPRMRFVPAFSVKDDPDCELFYKAKVT